VPFDRFRTRGMLTQEVDVDGEPHATRLIAPVGSQQRMATCVRRAVVGEALALDVRPHARLPRAEKCDWQVHGRAARLEIANPRGGVAAGGGGGWVTMKRVPHSRRARD